MRPMSRGVPRRPRSRHWVRSATRRQMGAGNRMPITIEQAPAPTRASERARKPSALIERSRAAQRAWSATPVRERLRVLRRLRHAIAAHGAELAGVIAQPDRTAAESFVAEIVPLADAIRFL